MVRIILDLLLVKGFTGQFLKINSILQLIVMWEKMYLTYKEMQTRNSTPNTD